MSRATMSQHMLMEKLNGTPRYHGEITVSGSVAVLAVSAGRVYKVQALSDDVYFGMAVNSSGAITKTDDTTAVLTTALGELVPENQTTYVFTGGADTHIAAIGTSGTLRVWELV